MSYDTLTMTAVTEELQALAGSRIQRVLQPSREVVILTLYHAGEERGLLLSSHPHHARVHLTRRRYRLPEQPPPFCMLLRKHLVGARISAIDQPPLERVLALHLEAHDGLPAVRLVAEIMGRRSNILLVSEAGTILGAIKTATAEQNPRRAVLPGLPYLEVPPQPKLDPRSGTEALSAAMLPHLVKGVSPEKALLKSVRAVSPLTARELVHRSGWLEEEPRGSIDRLGSEMRRLFGEEGEKEPCLFLESNSYAPYRLTHLRGGSCERFENMNELLDRFYGKLEETEERRILQGKLRSRVNRRKSRLERKLETLEEQLQRAGEADRYRIYGETLLTYGAAVSRGTAETMLPDLYRPEETISIPLDPSLDAVGNARKYFRIYRKVSDSRKHLQKQIRLLQQELAYCGELLYTIEGGSGALLREIGEELVEAGYMKAAVKKGSPSRRKKRDSEKTQPLSYPASSGRRILVGRNNRQNDDLTFRIAGRRDIWLHAQGLPGSHVIIRGGGTPPAESDLLEAALLAAHYSKGRDLSALAVDYTEVRHVRRGPGGRPGFVLYEPFKTIIVNPQDEKLHQLLERRDAE